MRTIVRNQIESKSPILHRPHHGGGGARFGRMVFSRI